MKQRMLWIAVLVACACGDTDASDAGTPPECVGPVCGVETITPSGPIKGCTYASPIAYQGADGTEVLVVASETLSALSSEGTLLWSVTLPAPDEEMAFAVATPVLIGDRLIVGYHTVERTSEPHDVNRARERQMIAVVDLAARRIDDAFEPLELSADFPANEGGVVPFTATNTLGRALAHVSGGADELGFVYATFGNARDIQPWHGFIFELDLDAWRKNGEGAAIRSSFLSTPETDCGTPGTSGSRGRECGGGMWAPSGPLVVERDDGPELFVSTSNGQLDLGRNDFATSVLRLRPGLDFDPSCDADACDDFDRDAPSRACVESCRDIFIPRDEPGDPFAWPESGACDGLTMFECWAKLDYIGGSTPAYVKLESGIELLAYPAKDGALYLFDADHLGTMYDRKQLVAVCGTESDECLWDWAGMIVTQPAVTEVDGEPLLLVPTFMPPAKDGALYLFDADHLGTMYDRKQLVAVCGTESDECLWDWAGMIVTQPAVTEVDGEPLLLVPTFMPDKTHPAGVVAVAITESDDGPKLDVRWQAPSVGDAAALARFRRHPSRIRLSNDGQVAWLVETAERGGRGKLLALRASDGAILVDQPLAGPGYRFTQPLVVGERVFVPSCEPDNGPSMLEIFDVH